MRGNLLISGAIALAVVLACPPAHAGLLEQVQRMAGNSEPSNVSATTAAKGPALGQFTASGTLSTTIQSGTCPNSVVATSCPSSTTCDEVQFSGPVTATSLGGNSTLSACMTVDNTAIGVNLLTCFDGLGTGTVTSKNGKNSVTLAFSGLLCVADESPLPTPTSAVFQVSGAYSVESGTGSFANAPSGAGSLSLSISVANIASQPFIGTGQVSLAGNIAK